MDRDDRAFIATLIKGQTKRIIDEIRADREEREMIDTEGKHMELLNSIQVNLGLRALDTVRNVRDMIDRNWTEEDGSEARKQEVLRAYDDTIARFEEKIR